MQDLEFRKNWKDAFYKSQQMACDFPDKMRLLTHQQVFKGLRGYFYSDFGLPDADDLISLRDTKFHSINTANYSESA